MKQDIFYVFLVRTLSRQCSKPTITAINAQVPSKDAPVKRTSRLGVTYSSCLQLPEQINKSNINLKKIDKNQPTNKRLKENGEYFKNPIYFVNFLY